MYLSLELKENFQVTLLPYLQNFANNALSTVRYPLNKNSGYLTVYLVHFAYILCFYLFFLGKDLIKDFIKVHKHFLSGTEEGSKIKLIHTKINNERNKTRALYQKNLKRVNEES